MNMASCLRVECIPFVVRQTHSPNTRLSQLGTWQEFAPGTVNDGSMYEPQHQSMIQRTQKDAGEPIREVGRRLFEAVDLLQHLVGWFVFVDPSVGFWG